MFKKGVPRHPNAGRKKGTPNKVCTNLEQLCADMGVDPFKVLIDHCKNIDPAISLPAAKEACKYLYPQRKAIEHSGEIKNPYLEKNKEELEALIKEKLK